MSTTDEDKEAEDIISDIPINELNQLQAILNGDNTIKSASNKPGLQNVAARFINDEFAVYGYCRLNTLYIPSSIIEFIISLLSEWIQERKEQRMQSVISIQAFLRGTYTRSKYLKRIDKMIKATKIVWISYRRWDDRICLQQWCDMKVEETKKFNMMKDQPVRFNYKIENKLILAYLSRCDNESLPIDIHNLIFTFIGDDHRIEFWNKYKDKYLRDDDGTSLLNPYLEFYFENTYSFTWRLCNKYKVLKLYISGKCNGFVTGYWSFIASSGSLELYGVHHEAAKFNNQVNTIKKRIHVKNFDNCLKAGKISSTALLIDGRLEFRSVTAELQYRLLANPQYNEELARMLVQDLRTDSESDSDDDSYEYERTSEESDFMDCDRTSLKNGQY